MAAGADTAPAGARGALHVRLPDPARRRRQGARGTRRTRARFHRPARVGRGLSARRRLDRPRSNVGTAGRRRTHSARVHRGSRQRGAGRGLYRPVPQRAPCRDDGDAHAGGSSRHDALQRRAVGGDRCVGRAGRPRSCRPRCALDARRRADIRLDRRHGRQGVDDRGARQQKARARRGAAAAADGALRAGWIRAHRPWQMVPGRAAAALGTRGLLAQRRGAAVGRRVAARRHPPPGACRSAGGARFHRRAGGGARAAAGNGVDCVRGRAAAAGRRSGAADQRRSASIGCVGSRRALAPCSIAALRSRSSGRLRSSAQGLAARQGQPGQRRLGNQPVAAAARAPVRGRRRFAAGPAASAVLAAEAASRRGRGRARGRPVLSACGAAGTIIAPRRARTRPRRRAARSRQDRADDPGARRPLVRLHAAAQARRGLHRVARRRRGRN